METAILKINLSQVIIIIQRECNAVGLDIFHRPYGQIPSVSTNHLIVSAFFENLCDTLKKSAMLC